MAPNINEEESTPDFLQDPGPQKLLAPQADSHQFELVYWIAIGYFYIHVAGVIGITCIFGAKWATLVFMYVFCVFGFMGITAGVHRLWSHQAYKATWPLQVILMLGHSTVCQFSVLWWSETHRQHHKYSDTDGDPHNATRSLLFSHFGWFMVVPHPTAKRLSQYVNTRDLQSNGLLQFQRRYCFFILGIMSFILPTIVPLLWGEDIFTSFHLNMLRLAVSYNCLFAVNSVAHRWGNRPYDKAINPTQNDWVSFFIFGEGYHNFHHSFPWDYRSDEWGGKWNFTTIFIEAFARIGWAYDLKSVSQEVIDSKVQRSGDGTIAKKTP